MKKTILGGIICSLISGYSLADEVEKIVIIAPMQTPLNITTDPKLPRQPLPAQDASDLLSSISGFSLVKKGAASSDPVFRGLAGSRLNILTDGNQTLGGCGNRMDPPTAYISPQTYDTLTVIKGPQTVLYGPGNSAATVLFERDSYRMEKSDVEGFSNLVLASANRKGINSQVKFGNENTYANISASYNSSDNYEDGQDIEIHSAYKKWNTDLELAYTPSDDKIISISVGRSDGEVAYADRSMDGSLFDRTHGAVKFDWALQGNILKSIEGQVFYNYVDHIMDNYSLRHFVAIPTNKAPRAMNPDRKTYGAKVLAHGELHHNGLFSIGLDHQQNEHTNRMSMNINMTPVEAQSRTTDGRFEQTGLFAEYELNLAEKQQWVSGLRIDRWQATDERKMVGSMMMMSANPTAQLTRKESLYSGFTRLQRQTDNVSYFAGFGYVERFPDYWELLGAGRSSETSSSAFNTQHEATSQIDLGLVHQSADWQSSVSIFYNQINDFILIDNTFVKMAKAHKVTRNVDTESFGFELDSKHLLNRKFTAGASVSWVRATNLTDHTPLAQQPALQGRFTLDYTLSDWQLGMLWRVVQKQNRIAVGQGNIAGQDVSATAGYGVLSLNANYSQSQNIDWSFGIDNLLDKTYSEHLSRAGAAVSGYTQIDKVNEAGLTAWLNLNWRF